MMLNFHMMNVLTYMYVMQQLVIVKNIIHIQQVISQLVYQAEGT